MKQFLLSAALIAVSTTVATAHTLDGIVKDNRTAVSYTHLTLPTITCV